MSEALITPEILEIINKSVDIAVSNAVNLIQQRNKQENEENANQLIILATQIGVNAGIEYINNEKKNLKKNRYDRRLRNTKLLLREFRSLAIYSKGAVYSKNKINAINLLDEIDENEYDDGMYIESIKASKERTAIIIEHIRKMMQIYRHICLKSKKSEDIRRFEIINDMYLKSERTTAEQLADKYHVNISIIYKDINIAVETLSSLVFGIDGLKIL